MEGHLVGWDRAPARTDVLTDAGIVHLLAKAALGLVQVLEGHVLSGGISLPALEVNLFALINVLPVDAKDIGRSDRVGAADIGRNGGVNLFQEAAGDQLVVAAATELERVGQGAVVNRPGFLGGSEP